MNSQTDKDERRGSMCPGCHEPSRGVATTVTSHKHEVSVDYECPICGTRWTHTRPDPDAKRGFN